MTSPSLNKYFELNNSWGCRPNANYLLTQSQVRYMTICSNLPIQKALACTELHSCKVTQTRPDCAIFFFLSFAHSKLHQTILLFIPSHIVCFLLEDRNIITCTHTHARTHTHSPEGHRCRCLAEAEKDSFEYKQRATGDNCS